jgi:hypothetical protein
VSHTSSSFALVILEIGSSELFAQAGLNVILQISASQVPRFIDVSHWHLAQILIFKNILERKDTE